MPFLSRGRALAAVALLAAAAPAQQPLPPDRQAEVPLAAGQKLLAEGNPAAAADQFRQVLDKFPNTPPATAARYGLGLAQLAGPAPDLSKAIEFLTPAADDGGFRDRGPALSALGRCQRELGLRELDKPAGTPDERKRRAGAAAPRFAAAAKRFDDARNWFGWQKQADPAGRARCDQAEALIRVGKLGDARGVAEPFTKDPELGKNPHRPLGLYLYGLALFLDREYQPAGRVLNQLAPFAQPGFGPHAKYLVGRILDLAGEGAEASVHYDGVLADYETAKKAAAEALKDADRFKGDPFEKARLGRLAAAPAPEYVAAAAVHAATLNYEAGKFGDALAKFQAFARESVNAPLRPDAELRAGLCLVRLKQFDEAAQVLEPLAENTPRLADQALLWLGKARLGQAAADPAGRDDKIKAALDLFRRAADKAGQVADPDAKARRQDARFEQADALQAAGRFRDAAGVYDQLWQEGALPARREELLQRRLAAWGAAGEWDKSDGLCDEFRRTFPASPLTPAAVFRAAENSYRRALAADQRKAPADEVKRRLDEAAGRYKEAADKYPEFDRVNPARLAAGVCLARMGQLDEAVAVLAAIPASDRAGELAPAGYLLADCLMRQAPLKADDALAENQVREKLSDAAKLLEAYLAADPKGVDAPAALLKLGLCQKRLGSTLADAGERNQALDKAKTTFDKLQKEYPDPYGSHGRLERAKVKSLQGDRGGAVADLRKFLPGAGWENSPVAPLAATHLAALLREENKPAEAEAVSAAARKRFEPELAGDPDRAEWAALLAYQHGLALFEQQKFADARPVFDAAAKLAGGRPVGVDARLRAGQCQVQEARKRIDDAQKLRNEAGNDRGKRDDADRRVRDGRGALSEAAATLDRRAAEARDQSPAAEGRARMLYDAAWAHRYLAEDEVNRAREQVRETERKRIAADLLNGQPPGTPAPYVQGPDVPRDKVPVQPAEAQAAGLYRKLIDEFPDAALAVEARVELAELLADPGDYAGAVKLLKEALDKEPADRPASPDTLARARLRLGACLFALKDVKAAQAQFDALAGDPKSPYRVPAAYRAGECRLAAGDPAGAVEALKPFLTDKDYRGHWQLTDVALLGLGRAESAAGRWEDARRAFEAALSEFGGGTPYKLEARFGLAAALQGEGRFDAAVGEFEKVVTGSTGELGAKARAQLGRCKLRQKKYAEAAAALMAVAYGPDGPAEVRCAALVDAAEAYAADGKPAEGEAALRKVLADAPKESEWAKAAAERLGKMGK